MKKLMLILLAGLLAGGCSLTGDDAPDGTAGLRLLVGDSKSKTVSDLKANDWSPQMVHVGTSRYLYFLSDRYFVGQMYANENWATIGTNDAGNHAIFRVQEMEPGVFSNVQMWYRFGTGTQIAAMVLPVTNDTRLPKAMIIVKVGENSFTNMSLVDQGTGGISFNPSFEITGQVVPAGCMVNQSENYMFFGRKIPMYFEDYPHQVLVLSNYLSEFELPLVDNYKTILLSVQQTSGEAIGFDFLKGRGINGAWPANFHRVSDGKKCFGFYVSYGGVLSVLLYRQFSDYEAFLNFDISFIDTFSSDLLFRQSIIALPLLRVTHYAGTIDRNPSYDPATGLYFSSNRDGKYNLYLVPKEYLYLPDWLEFPEQIGGSIP